jgi:hypothetical protein
MIRRVKIPTITLVGVDGSAVGTGYSQPIAGRILAVHVNHSSGGGTTTDVTLATNEAPVQTILAKVDSATDAWYYPRIAVHDTAGAAVTYDGTRPIYEPQPVADIVKATIAQGDSAETVDITIIYEE